MVNLFNRCFMSVCVLIILSLPSFADQVFIDDLIVNGSGCVGLDCIDGEPFGFDTLRLKENNLRFHFDDTSNTAGFPANDWRLIINDSDNGGLNRFSIEDATSGKTPFTVEAGALTHSLYIDALQANSARIGIGTSSPVTLIHALNGDTPTLRLEQDNRNGWNPYTWDIAGNETNFFIRDTKNGSKLPFRLFPGAGDNSLTVSANSNIGMGIHNPSASLHIKKTGLTATDKLLLIQNDAIDALTLDGNGNLTASGTISHGSSRSIKKEIEPVDPDDILEQLLQLDIYTWQYISDENTTHLGPMAEDFGDIFNLGEDNKHIAPGDMGGIAFAAIQSLNKKVELRDQTINALEKQNKELTERLERLEHLVETMMTHN